MEGPKEGWSPVERAGFDGERAVVGGGSSSSEHSFPEFLFGAFDSSFVVDETSGGKRRVGGRESEDETVDWDDPASTLEAWFERWERWGGGR